MNAWIAVGMFVAVLAVILTANRQEARADARRMIDRAPLRALVALFTPVVLIDTLAFGSLTWSAASLGNAGPAVAVGVAALIGVMLIAASLRILTSPPRARAVVPFLLVLWATAASLWLVGYLAAAAILG